MNPSATREQALDLYYYLRLNRSLEELLARLFRQDKINGGLYGSRGQEAIPVGAAYALGPDDWMAPMIRNIGALLVRGFRPRDVLTQHMGRVTSPTQGKDGTSHFGDLSNRHVIAPISMLLSEKSKIAAFSVRRSCLLVRGMTTMFCCTR